MQLKARRGMSRGLIVAAGAAALAGGTFFAAPALAAAGGSECQLAGTANFDPPGLSATSGNFSYDFSGDLSGCNASGSGAPTQGTVAAGKDYTVTVSGTNAATGLPYSVTYALPQSTGVGGCAQSTTQGVSIATWPDGSTTVIDYTTTGALAAVALQGTVAPSAVLPELSSSGSVPAGTPSTVTVASTNTSFPAGDDVAGLLAFSVSDPTQCQTGVTTAGISGVTGLGSTS